MSTSTDTVEFFRGFVRRKAAIVVEPGKEYLIESRLGPIAREAALADIDALAKSVRADEGGALAKKVVEAMTTNETSFFRDVHPWEALRQHLLPPIVKARASVKTLRIWCAAASTGQEPYTIAMVIREHFPELASWNVQIIATDINEIVLERARSGIYKQLEVNRGLPAQMLVKYFDRVGVDWQVKADLRRMITFTPLNLIGKWSLFTQQDIVFIRNVLIYFDVPTKREILGRIRKEMRDDGFLMLGGAETTLNIDDGFMSQRAGNTIVYQPKKAADAERKVANASR